MIYTCNEHLIKGVQTIQVPHVNKVSPTKFVCQFCGKQGYYKLFTLISKNHKGFTNLR